MQFCVEAVREPPLHQALAPREGAESMFSVLCGARMLADEGEQFCVEAVREPPLHQALAPARGRGIHVLRSVRYCMLASVEANRPDIRR